MARRKQTTAARRPARFSAAVEAALPPPPIPAAFLAPPDTDWVDDEDPPLGEVPAEGVPETAPKPATLSVRGLTDLDIDQLWDWVRQDEDRGAAFLEGKAPATARDLYAHFARLAAEAADDRARTYVLTHADLMIGCIVLSPLRRVAREAILSLYLAPAVRGRIHDLLPELLALAAVEQPGLTLFSLTTDPARMRLMTSVGFQVTYVLKYTPGTEA